MSENMYRRTVQLHITTRLIGEEEHAVERRCEGELLRKNGSWYIRYQEDPGEMGDTTTIVKLEAKQVTIIRHGQVTMRQTYRLDERQRGEYHSPYGKMEMETKTEKLEVIPTTNSLQQFHLRYRLWLNRQWVGRQDVKVVIKEVEAN